MHYIVYKITNQLNGKFYIGVHTTKNIDDGYMGSGTYLKRAIQKHGIENFKKEILFVFDSEEAMYLKEEEIVNEEFLMTENTYNLRVGGFGRINSQRRLDPNFDKKAKNKQRELGVGFFDPNVRRKARQRCIELERGFMNPEKRAKGVAKAASAEANTKRKETMRLNNHSIGKNNSQYGTRWIYSPTEKISRKIQKDEPLPDGWFEGRKIKF